ncbi:MAG: hypothetical protein K2O85_04045 [Helicobacter sp.]|nr:hypothetical protein [Helicobacter sp.]
MLLVGTMFIVSFFNACSFQRQISAVEMGCKKENVAFPQGEISWYEFMPQYWEANCGNKKYVCQPSGIAIFQAPSAKCKEIIP